MDLKKRWELFL